MAFLTSASSAINTQPIMAQFLKTVITVFFLGLRWVFTPYAGSWAASSHRQSAKRFFD
jgi:hypothetical protein